MRSSYIYKKEEKEKLIEKLSILDKICEDNSEYVGDLYVEGIVPEFLKTQKFYGWKVIQFYKDKEGNTLVIKDKHFVNWKHNFVLKTLINDDYQLYFYFDEDTSREDSDVFYVTYLISEEDYLKIRESISNGYDLTTDFFSGGIPKTARRLFYVNYNYSRLGNSLLEYLFEEN